MNIQQIDGSTRLYAIIGDPISAVRSPQEFNAMFARQGINAVMVALRVDAAGLAAAWGGLKVMRNLEGLVVTMPHKAGAAALVDLLGRTATLVGAVNAVRREPDGRWHGDTFDGRGCVEGLRRQGHEVTGKDVFLLGAGGAGAAIAVALAEARVRKLVVQDIDPAKRDHLVARLGAAFPSLPVRAGSLDGDRFDVAINATPVGMREEDGLPFDPAPLPASTLIVDVITKPEMTPLLERAASTGHPVHSGRHMHRGQAIGVARFFGFDLDS